MTTEEIKEGCGKQLKYKYRNERYGAIKIGMSSKKCGDEIYEEHKNEK
jgi:hypothetical protein